MTAHAVHPDSHENGLADGCPRCAEHAENPLASLDARNLRELVRRAVEDEPARSEAEALATARVREALERAGKIAEVAPVALAHYLAERWRASLPAVPLG